MQFLNLSKKKELTKEELEIKINKEIKEITNKLSTSAYREDCYSAYTEMYTRYSVRTLREPILDFEKYIPYINNTFKNILGVEFKPPKGFYTSPDFYDARLILKMFFKKKVN